MSLSYTIRESVSGFTRTKLSSVVSIITIGISLLLLGLFGVVTIHATRFVDDLRSRVELEAFLRRTDQSPRRGRPSPAGHPADRRGGSRDIRLQGRRRADLQGGVRRGYPGRARLQPSPAVVQDHLAPGIDTPTRARAARRATSVAALMAGGEPSSTGKALLELIDERSTTVQQRHARARASSIGLSAILLVSNTIRLAIYAKRKIIRTMELVGATRARSSATPSCSKGCSRDFSAAASRPACSVPAARTAPAAWLRRNSQGMSRCDPGSTLP